MPIVPYRRRVSEAPISSVKEQGFANAESFGADSARQIGQLGDIASNVGRTAIKLGQLEDQKLAKAAAREALANAQKESDAVLFGDGDKYKGLYNRQGLEVKTVIDDFEKSTEDIRRKHTEKLDAFGKELFDASFDNYKAGNGRSLSKFRGAEIEKYDIATKDAENKQLVDNSIINRSAIDENGNNQFIDDAQKRISQNVASKYSGYGKEVRDQKVMEATNNLHASVLDAHLLDDPKKAKDYMDKYGDKMVAITREKYNKVIDKGLENQLVRDKSLELLNGYTEEDAYKAINKIKDVDVAAKVKRAVKDGFSEKKYFAEQKYNNYYEGLRDEVLKDPMNFDVMKHLGDLKGPDQEHLVRMQRSMKKEAMGGRVDTDWATYDRLMKLPQNELQKVNLPSLKGKLSTADFKTFVKMQASGDQDYKSVQSLNSFVSSMSKAVVGTKVTKENQLEQSRLRQAFQTELDAALKQGKPNNIDTWNRIQDLLVKEMNVEGFFNLSNQPFYKTLNGEYKAKQPADTPDWAEAKGLSWFDAVDAAGVRRRGWFGYDENEKANGIYVDTGKNTLEFTKVIRK